MAIVTNMNDFNIQEEFKKLDEEEHAKILEHGAIRHILKISREDTKEYRFGDMSIKVLATIPKDQRRTVTQLRRLARSEDEDEEDALLERSEELFYSFLARMCPESPFDLVETWKYIDEQTGVVPKVAAQVIELCGKDELKVAEFRSDR